MTVRTAISFAVAWVLCLAILVVFHVAYVMPREQALAVSCNNAQAKSERFDLLTRAKSAPEQERLKIRQAELEHQYSDFVFSSEAMTRLDFAIRGIAEKNGLQDFSSRHMSTTTNLGKTRLKQIAQSELLISFTGDFRGMLRFVNDLERQEPVVFVNQFTLRGAPTKVNTLACDMECSVLYQVTGK